MDLKNRPKMPSEGSESPSFPDSLDFPLNAGVTNLFDTNAAQA
jgi:hypothetical protein